MASTVAEVLGTSWVTDGGVEASGNVGRGSSAASVGIVASAVLGRGSRGSTAVTKAAARLASLELSTDTLGI